MKKLVPILCVAISAMILSNVLLSEEEMTKPQPARDNTREQVAAQEKERIINELVNTAKKINPQIKFTRTQAQGLADLIISDAENLKYYDKRYEDTITISKQRKSKNEAYIVNFLTDAPGDLDEWYTYVQDEYGKWHKKEGRTNK